MFEAKAIVTIDKAELYRDVAEQLGLLLSGEHDRIANAANTAALLFQYLPDLNWAGFYFMAESGGLVLGPFQGKPACVRIPIGRGVCGTAVAERRSIVVEDVHAFPGHIACDVGSRSELVVPLFEGDRIIGVIDLDSPLPARFDTVDCHGIEAIARIFVASLNSAQLAVGST